MYFHDVLSQLSLYYHQSQRLSMCGKRLFEHKRSSSITLCVCMSFASKNPKCQTSGQFETFQLFRIQVLELKVEVTNSKGCVASLWFIPCKYISVSSLTVFFYGINSSSSQARTVIFKHDSTLILTPHFSASDFF